METTDTPKTDAKAFKVEHRGINNAWETEQIYASDAREIERECNEWQAIAKDALAAFRCTQRPEIYPEGHWSRRAQSLLENDNNPATGSK